MKDLLLLLCQYPFDLKNRDRLGELLGEVADWKVLVKLINAHGIIALAHYNIKEANLEKSVPNDALAFLRNGQMQSIVRNSWLTERWKEVNTILEDAGIKHILLKGMALEHTIYGGQGLRQMNDNDIFINPEYSIKAWHLLQEKGFTQEPFKSPLFKKMIFSLGRHLPALYKEGYALEIHDRLFENENPVAIEPPDLFADAREITIGKTKALILSEKWQLKHLVHHFEHHMQGGDCQLRLYSDIVLVKSGTQIQFHDNFIEEPIQSGKPEFRKAAYKRNIRAIPPEYRLRFIIGDTIPTLKWMKKRYKCNGVKALLIYPLRLAKLRFLII